MKRTRKCLICGQIFVGEAGSCTSCLPTDQRRNIETVNVKQAEGASHSQEKDSLSGTLIFGTFFLMTWLGLFLTLYSKIEGEAYSYTVYHEYVDPDPSVATEYREEMVEVSSGQDRFYRSVKWSFIPSLILWTIIVFFAKQISDFRT